MEKEIKAIILAAGKGTRMKSAKPKVLHEIFSKPILGWVIDSISNLPYDAECIAVIGHGASVEEYLNNNYKYVKTAFQKEQLGTGHAVAQTLQILHDYRGLVLILCGDTPLITTKTLRNLIKYHEENACDLTVLTTDFDDPVGYGRIVRNYKGEIIKIIEEKDASESVKEIKEVNTGVYCLNWSKLRKAFNELGNNNAQGEYYLTDIIKWSRDNSFKILGYKISDNREIFGINSRKHLAIATSIMNERYLDKLMDNGVTIVDPKSTYISSDTTIGADTIIYPNTYIEGRNAIGYKCKIGPMTHLRGNCEIADECKIGNFVELKNVKISQKTNVCHLTYVGDAKIGRNVNVGAGTIFANYNSITKQKQTTFVADEVSIGSNSVLVAPVKIDHGAFIAASSCITKDVSANSLAIARNNQKEIADWVKNKKGE